jgi:hypothetical protein
VDVAEPIIDAVKQGALRHFVLIGGCDGGETSRGYFTELARGGAGGLRRADAGLWQVPHHRP